MMCDLVNAILQVVFRFGCYMLQTYAKNKDGEWKWRDVECDKDEDDFAAL